MLLKTAQEEDQREWSEAELATLLAQPKELHSGQLLKRLKKHIRDLAQAHRLAARNDNETFPGVTPPGGPPPDNPASPIEKEKDYSREIANITKMYTEEQQYSGTEENDNLDHKLAIF